MDYVTITYHPAFHERELLKVESLSIKSIFFAFITSIILVAILRYAINITNDPYASILEVFHFLMVIVVIGNLVLIFVRSDL